jgi:hypothetical protein
MSNEPGLKVTVVPLSSSRDIYLVVDERNKPLGTGTKEVCEFLAELIVRPYDPLLFERRRPPVRSVTQSNVRSAIRI